MQILKTAVVCSVAVSLAFAGAATAQADSDDRPTLIDHAVLAADTFVPNSEKSGYFTNAETKPFPGQVIQGVSAIHTNRDGSVWAMSDNGFGTKENSPDYILRVNRMQPITTMNRLYPLPGWGFNLSDPHGHIPFQIWRDGGCEAATELPEGYTCPARDRQLTGWDFDLESMQFAPDGTIWFGEEFGPYLLHTDARGRLLEAPIATPGVKSPQNPTLGDEETPNAKRSGGYEGLAITADGKHLIAAMEGAIEGDDPTLRRLYTVNIDGKAAFTGEYSYYRMDAANHNVGDYVAVNDHQYLMIERDNNWGDKAETKKIYLVDMNKVDADGVVHKELLVDLLNMRNADKRYADGDTASFPFICIESVDFLDNQTLIVFNDNNYPWTRGPIQGIEHTEAITIKLPQPLDVAPTLLPGGMKAC